MKFLFVSRDWFHPQFEAIPTNVSVYFIAYRFNMLPNFLCIYALGVSCWKRFWRSSCISVFHSTPWKGVRSYHIGSSICSTRPLYASKLPPRRLLHFEMEGKSIFLFRLLLSIYHHGFLSAYMYYVTGTRKSRGWFRTLWCKNCCAKSLYPFLKKWITNS